MAAIRIYRAVDSPLPCALHHATGGCREVTIDSEVGRLTAVLCDDCYAPAPSVARA